MHKWARENSFHHLYTKATMIKKFAILCVDDERIILDSLRIQIEKQFKHEYIYEYAESAEEAFEVVDELLGMQIDLLLVISDYQMPGMKGDAFAEALKEKLPNLNIVLLTGQMPEEISMDLINRHIILKVVHKPWKERELIEIIEKLSVDAGK